MNAAVVARAMGINVVAMTGADGGELGRFADVAIRVPESETYMVQELHLPVYHCLCLMLEDYFFGN
jgi:D-sedoheptulose 7-phosphate isomerase